MRDTTSLGIGREALSSLVSNVTMGLVGFAGTLVFARVLGASGLGVYQTAIAAAFVFTKLSSGVAGAVKKRVSEVDTDAARFLGVGILAHTGFTVLVALLALVALEPASDYFGSVGAVAGGVAVVAALGLFNVLNEFYAGIGYPARASWMDTIRSAFTITCQFVLLWMGLQAFGVIAGLAIGTFFAALLSGLAAGVRPAVPTRHTLARVFTFARWSVPNGLLSNLYSSSDILIVTAAAGNAAAGFYAVARQLSQPATFLSSAISGAFSVKASGRHSAEQEVVTDLLNSVAYAGLFAVPMFFGALAMPRALPRTVFGGEYAAASGALIGMTLFQVANVYSWPLRSVFGSIDRPDVEFRVNALVTVVHLPLAVTLGYEVGLLGVVAATVVAETMRFVVYLYLAYDEFGRLVLPRPVAEQVASAIVMFLALEAALTAVSVRSWVVLLALIGGGAAIYFGVLFAVSSHFRLSIRHAVPIEVGPLKTP